MKKLLICSFLTLAIFFVILVVLHSKQSSADPGDFDKVIPFTTVGGLMGFFDQSNGKVYLYDGNLQDCILVSQLEELGKSMKRSQ